MSIMRKTYTRHWCENKAAAWRSLFYQESDVRALRQQFGVPMRLLRHTGVYGLWLHQAKPTSDQGDDLSLFSSLRGGPATRAMDHWCELPELRLEVDRSPTPVDRRGGSRSPGAGVIVRATELPLGVGSPSGGRLHG